MINEEGDYLRSLLIAGNMQTSPSTNTDNDSSVDAAADPTEMVIQQQ